MGRSGIEKAPDELYESVADIVREVGLRVVQLDPLPGGKGKFGDLANGKPPNSPYPTPGSVNRRGRCGSSAASIVRITS